jgi:hypothetical protein
MATRRCPWVHAKLDSGRRRNCSDAPATQQISDWLEKLGMSEYAQRFAENGIVGVIAALVTFGP